MKFFPILLFVAGMTASAQQINFALPSPDTTYAVDGGAPTYSIDASLIPVVMDGTNDRIGTMSLHDDWSGAGGWIRFAGGLSGYGMNAITKTDCQVWQSITFNGHTGLYCTQAYVYFSTPQYNLNLVTWYMNYYFGGKQPCVHRNITKGSLTFNVNKTLTDAEPGS